jgi:cellulose synthase/poly-beta-1,6-N-acetylglucosamine synthase-like glycosyltransferase
MNDGLARKQNAAFGRGDAPIFTTVIVPFYGKNFSQLSECLTAVSGQNYPQADFELIVVDNNPKPVLLDRRDFLPKRCLVVHEPRAGSYAARNRGLAMARGELIAFTDSDCRPATDWLRHGTASLAADPSLGFAAGHIQMTWKRAKPSTIEVYDACVSFQQKSYVKFGYGATANLFTRASVIAAVGRFDEAFFSGGDRDWGRRVSARGYGCSFAPDAVVFHPARDTLSALVTKQCRLVGQEFVLATRANRPIHRILLTEVLHSLRIVLVLLRRRADFGPLAISGAFAVALLVRTARLLEWGRLCLGGRLRR